MNVDVHALGDRLDGFANRATIFDYRFVLGHVTHRDFVAKWNVVKEFDFASGFAFQRDSANRGPLFQVHDGHADVIAGLVQ